MCFALMSIVLEDDDDEPGHRVFWPPHFLSCDEMTEGDPCISGDNLSEERLKSALSGLLQHPRNGDEAILDLAIYRRLVSNPFCTQPRWAHISDLGQIYFEEGRFINVVLGMRGPNNMTKWEMSVWNSSREINDIDAKALQELRKQIQDLHPGRPYNFLPTADNRSEAASYSIIEADKDHGYDHYESEDTISSPVSPRVAIANIQYGPFDSDRRIDTMFDDSSIGYSISVVSTNDSGFPHGRPHTPFNIAEDDTDDDDATEIIELPEDVHQDSNSDTITDIGRNYENQENIPPTPEHTVVGNGIRNRARTSGVQGPHHGFSTNGNSGNLTNGNTNPSMHQSNNLRYTSYLDSNYNPLLRQANGEPVLGRFLPTGNFPPASQSNNQDTTVGLVGGQIGFVSPGDIIQGEYTDGSGLQSFVDPGELITGQYGSVRLPDIVSGDSGLNGNPIRGNNGFVRPSDIMIRSEAWTGNFDNRFVRPSDVMNNSHNPTGFGFGNDNRFIHSSDIMDNTNNPAGFATGAPISDSNINHFQSQDPLNSSVYNGASFTGNGAAQSYNVINDLDFTQPGFLAASMADDPFNEDYMQLQGPYFATTLSGTTLGSNEFQSTTVTADSQFPTGFADFAPPTGPFNDVGVHDLTDPFAHDPNVPLFGSPFQASMQGFSDPLNPPYTSGPSQIPAAINRSPGPRTLGSPLPYGNDILIQPDESFLSTGMDQVPSLHPVFSPFRTRNLPGAPFSSSNFPGTGATQVGSAWDASQPAAGTTQASTSLAGPAFSAHATNTQLMHSGPRNSEAKRTRAKMENDDGADDADADADADADEDRYVENKRGRFFE